MNVDENETMLAHTARQTAALEDIRGAVLFMLALMIVCALAGAAAWVSA